MPVPKRVLKEPASCREIKAESRKQFLAQTKAPDIHAAGCVFLNGVAVQVKGAFAS